MGPHCPDVAGSPLSLSSEDLNRLAEALALAEQAIGLCEPNPRVGCVLGRPGSATLGQGHTQRVGGPHAEVMALRDAQSRGVDVRGATAWVTLEPCAHHGRTPPCCDALIAAGLARVVVAVLDPFEGVNGQGVHRLREAGIQVELAPADIQHAARELNIGFFSRVQRQRPWVRMKIAASVDGRTALPDGTSQWITSEAARADGHAWRRRAGAVLTGIGTVLEDNPRLDVRAVTTAHQPQRVVVDSRLQTPPGARIVSPPGALWLYAAQDDPQRAAALRATGASIVCLPSVGQGIEATTKVDLGAMLADLATRGINELHVEAGHKLNGSLLRGGWVDELLIYLAPKLLGTGREMAHFGPLASLNEAVAFEFVEAVRVGPDLRLRLRRRSG